MCRCIQDKHCRIVTTAENGRECASELVLLVPDEGVVIQGIVDVHIRVEGGSDFGFCTRSERWKYDVALQTHIRNQRSLTARATHGNDPVVTEWATVMEKFQRFNKRRNGCHPRNAISLEQCVVKCVCTCK